MLKISLPKGFGNISISVFIFISFFLLLNSCAREVKVKKQLSIKNGVIFETENKKLFTGTISDTVSNQVLTYEVVEGLKNGEFRVADMKGKILMAGTVKDNKNEGRWKYYYPSGKLESSGSFKNDLAEGKWAWFYEDGTLKEEGNFVNGKRDGVWHLYDKNGYLENTLVFQEGKKISESGRKNFLST